LVNRQTGGSKYLLERIGRITIVKISRKDIFVDGCGLHGRFWDGW